MRGDLLIEKKGPAKVWKTNFGSILSYDFASWASLEERVAFILSLLKDY